MIRMGKYLTISFVVILAVFGLLTVNSVNAQTIPTPAVPEFSVNVVDRSYDVPANTTTITDPYTGEQITTTQPGYHVEKYTIDVKIRNQPFTSDDELIDLFFNIRLRGHYEPDWTELYHITGGTNDNCLLKQSGTEFTIYSMPQRFPSHGSIDFQVEAFIAVGHRISYTNFGYWTWQKSGWSPTQTSTIGDTNSSSTFSSSITNIPYPSLPPVTTQTPSPTPTPTVPEFPITATLIAVLAILSLLLIIGKRKQSFNH